MPAPEYLASDFTQALANLLPRGRAWPRDPDTVQQKYVAALAPTYARQSARDAQLLVDGFPATAVELLPEWEASLGLPDPCAGLSPTIQQREQQVVARFTTGGGQSTAFFTDLAAALGYDVTITEFTQFHFGMTFALPLCSAAWDHVWQVNAPTFTVNHFEFGVSGMGEFFSSFGNTVLQCELFRLAPAHTTVLFSFS